MVRNVDSNGTALSPLSTGMDFRLKKIPENSARYGFPYDSRGSDDTDPTFADVSFTFPRDILSKIKDALGTSPDDLLGALVSGIVVLLDRYDYGESKDVIVEVCSNNLVTLNIHVDDTITFDGLFMRVMEQLQAPPVPYIDDSLLPDTLLFLEGCGEKAGIEQSNANMMFILTVLEDTIQGVVQYNTSLYRQETIEKITEHYTNFLSFDLSHMEDELHSLDILSIEEKEQLMTVFNNTTVDHGCHRTITQLFEEAVQRTPENIALVYRNKQWTYCELNEKANQVAVVLREKGVKPDNIVGIMVDRSLEMLVAILAVQKSGGAYLPIDPAYPAERTLYLMSDSAGKLLLTQEIYRDFAVGIGLDGEVLVLDDESLYQGATENLESVNKPGDLAYIIYTSGSTGKPKGVMIEHASAVNLLETLYGYYPMDESDAYLLKTSYLFDVSVSELFGWFHGGGRLVILEKNAEKNPHDILDAIGAARITHINFVPSMFNLFVNILSPENTEKLASLKYIFLAGEAIGPDSIRVFRLLTSDTPISVKIENLYGPTEATVYASRYPVDQWDGNGNIPIGKPLDNLKLYTSASSGTPQVLQPVGVDGELGISGIGLARGYLNRPELTAEKFIANPFHMENEPYYSPAFNKLYRTGDLTRRLPDGNIEFLDRIDHQVKIRGFRIETGEIESCILKEKDIKEAVVIARKDRMEERYLCAYFVSPEPIDVSELRINMMTHIPEYMIPSYFLQIEAVPLTTSGKVDRSKLPDPEIKEKGADYAPPQTETEKQLLDIWAEVLGIKDDVVGIDDNFFKLGGQSLKAAVITVMIHKVLDVKVTMAELFEFSTIRKLANYIQNAHRDKYESILPVEKREYYPQSAVQKRQYVLYQMQPDSIGYNMQLMDVHYENIDNERLEYAFRAMIQRHESLRTSFHMIDEMAVQRVHDTVTFEIEYHETDEGRTGYADRRQDEEFRPDVFSDPRRRISDRRKSHDHLVSSLDGDRRHLSHDCDSEAVADIVRVFVRPFDLSRAPLMRVGLINVMGKRRVLMVDMHHIISDGVSMDIFVRELRAFYAGEPLFPLEIQYKDYSQWAGSPEKQTAIKKQERFWLDQFQGTVPVLELPMDFTRPASLTFDGETIHFRVNLECAHQLNSFAHEQGSTLFILLLTLFYILIAKLSGQEDIVVGTMSAGRKHADLQHIIGMFVNTLALRNFPESRKTVKQFHQEVKERTVAAFENQDYQFNDLVPNVDFRRDSSRNPLFDVSFGLENEAGQTGYLLEVSTLASPKPYSYKTNVAKFDLTLLGVETEEGLEFNFEYNTRLFKPETVERYVSYYQRLLHSVCRSKAEQIANLEIISEKEKQLLLFEFNQTEAEFSPVESIVHLFEHQVELVPDAKALVFKDCQLSYKELNTQANRLAHFLKAKGVGPDTIVGIITEPSVQMVVGLLAILKAGGGYLPLDQRSPSDRIAYILNESGLRYLLTGPPFDYKVTGNSQSVEQFSIEDPIVKECSEVNPQPMARSMDLAYIIYTSGTTGRPKGVAVAHGSLVNYIQWRLEAYEFSPGDITLQLLSYAFDGFCSNFYAILAAGGVLVMIPDAKKMDYGYIIDILVKRCVTNTSLVPGMYEALLFNTGNNELNCLRFIVLAGERAGSHLIRKSRQENPQLRHIIEYGPTEATVAATANLDIDYTDTAIIGKPLANSKIYIRDEHGKTCPIGVPGEMSIAGDCLARGYLNRPDLTMEKFPKEPFRLYHTGDMARWLPDGNIEFMGRIDRQVKIRGFRVELGEIETFLENIDYVKEAVVVDLEDSLSKKYLCAYLVLEENNPAKKINVAELRDILARDLPDYMIPTYFMEIDHIPLTRNGKLDRDALPEAKMATDDHHYEPPVQENEILLADVWRKVLGLEAVGIGDDFFTLGGDSIKAIQIISKLKKRHLNLDVTKLFLHKTIKQLVKHLETIDEDKIADQSIVEGTVKLTAIQKWFLQNHRATSSHFNQSVLIFRKKGFLEENVRKAFTEIILHHDALRMVYEINGETICQRNRGIDGNLFDLEIIRLNDKDKSNNESNEQEMKLRLKQEADRIQRSFNLETGPLVKLAIFKELEGDRLLVVVHHLVVDGVSWRILLDDFETAYRKTLDGEPIYFQPKTNSFKDWAEKINKYANSKKLLKELPYWRAVDESEFVPIPVDVPIERDKFTFRHRIPVTIRLTAEETAQLLKRANRAYNTEINDILLTAMGLTIKQWAGTGCVLIDLEGHGREKVVDDIDIDRTVGWFTSQYPVMLDMRDTGSIGEAVKQVKETLRRIPNKGVGYGILKYLTDPALKDNNQFQLQPEIIFNYLGQFQRESYTSIEINEISEVSELGMGDSISPDMTTNHKIDVEGITSGNIMEISFLYNEFAYDRESIEELADMFKLNLVTIIRHCLEKRTTDKTPSDFGYNKISIKELDRIKTELQTRCGETQTIERIFPLGPLQHEVYAYAYRNRGLCFVENNFYIRGNLDQLLLEQSIHILFQRYTVFRNLFTNVASGDPLSLIIDEERTTIDYRDITHLSPGGQEAFWEDFKYDELERGFPLENDHLVRITLFRTGENSWILAWNYHHILMNTYSFEIIFKDLLRIYICLKESLPTELELPEPYENYIEWLERQDRDSALAYWREYFHDFKTGKTISSYGKDPGEDHYYETGEIHYFVDEAVTGVLMEKAREAGVTPVTMYKLLWALVLRQYSGCDDVVFGNVVSGRQPGNETLDRTVGLLVNVTPLRINLAEGNSLLELASAVQKKETYSSPHEFLPMSDIIANAAPQGTVVDHILAIEDGDVETSFKTMVDEAEIGFTLEKMENHERTNSDFNMVVTLGKRTRLNIHYNAAIYDRNFAEGVLETFIRQLDQVEGLQ